MRYWKKAVQHRDRNRALWAGAVILLICAGSLYLAGNVVKSSDQFRNSSRNGQGAGAGQKAASAGHATGEDYLATGSILFVPQQGNVCRERLIDNKTWFMRDKGYVICDEAVSWNATMQAPTHSSYKRLDAVRSGFNKK